MFHKAVIGVLAEYDMIKERNPQNIACLPQAFRYVDVLFRRLDVPRRMIMGDDDGTGSVGNRDLQRSLWGAQLFYSQARK